ncbi:MAG: cyclophilin-like fold protein [Eubacteriales bacterium]
MKNKFTAIFCAAILLVSFVSFAACSYAGNNGGETMPDVNPPITDDRETITDGEITDETSQETSGSLIPVDGEKFNTATVYMEITITAGDTVLEAVLFDNKTARAVADMLPLTVSTWHPAPNFARAFDLPQSFSYFPDEPPQMSYELGSLAYWEPGPSIAMIYNASRDQTVVPVVPIGKITSNLSVIENYSGTITVEKK